MQRASITIVLPSLRSRHIVVAVVAAALLPGLAMAQPCHGTPRGTAFAYERGKYQLGNSNGISATFAGRRVAAGIDAAMRDYSSDFKGQQANVRLSLVLGSSRVQVCPGIRLGFARDKWEYAAGSDVRGTMVAAAGGINVGLEQRVAGDFSVIPFAGAFYRFAATGFSIGAANSENAVGGDTASTVAIEYGLVGRFRLVYGGIALERTSDTKGLNPGLARYIVGISISGMRGGGGSSARSSTAIDRPRR